MSQPAFDLFTYPQSPGWKARQTSAAAAESMRPKASILREKVLAELRLAPGTADEISDRLHIDRLSIRPRCSELSNLGRIVDTGQRRQNDSGKSAIVWMVAP